MDLASFSATVGLLAAFVLPLVQLLKQQLGIKGRATLLLSSGLGMALGTTFAAGGMVGFHALPAWPPAVGGALFGLLASGGKDLITGIQVNGAQAQAQSNPPPDCSEAEPTTELTIEPMAEPAAEPAGTIDRDDSWQDASLEALAAARER